EDLPPGEIAQGHDIGGPLRRLTAKGRRHRVVRSLVFWAKAAASQEEEHAQRQQSHLHDRSFASAVASDTGVLSGSPRLVIRAMRRSITAYSTGMKNTPSAVATNMPPHTAVPSDQRECAPAPLATTNGTTPRMKANEVIKIGRKRNCAAATAASTIVSPSRSCCSLANSTIRMAFLAARPMSITRPIWT